MPTVCAADLKAESLFTCRHHIGTLSLSVTSWMIQAQALQSVTSMLRIAARHEAICNMYMSPVQQNDKSTCLQFSKMTKKYVSPVQQNEHTQESTSSMVRAKADRMLCRERKPLPLSCPLSKPDGTKGVGVIVVMGIGAPTPRPLYQSPLRHPLLWCHPSPRGDPGAPDSPWCHPPSPRPLWCHSPPQRSLWCHPPFPKPPSVPSPTSRLQHPKHAIPTPSPPCLLRVSGRSCIVCCLHHGVQNTKALLCAISSYVFSLGQPFCRIVFFSALQRAVRRQVLPVQLTVGRLQSACCLLMVYCSGSTCLLLSATAQCSIYSNDLPMRQAIAGLDGSFCDC